MAPDPAGDSGTATDARVDPMDSGPVPDAPPSDARDSAVPPADTALDAPPGSDWLPGYVRRKRIVIPGRGLAGPISGYPVAVKLRTDDDLRDHAEADGADIAFTSADGRSLLPYEIEKYISTDGYLTAWVKLPRLEAAAETVLYLYYDNSGTASMADPHATWDDYAVGVWHLTAGTTRGAYDDSTRASNHGARVSPGQEPTDAGGVAGRSRAFDGSDDSITLGDPGDGSLDFGMQSFTYSVWVRIDRAVGSWDMPWYKGGASAGDHGFDMELGTSDWRGGISDGSIIRTGRFGFDPSFDGRWAHLVAVIDRPANAFVLYADGTAVDRVDITGLGSVDTDGAAYIGLERYPVLGRIDEVRLHRRALTADEVAVEHDNLIDPGFMRVEAEETRP